MAKIQNNNNIKCCQECGKNKKSLSILVRLKNGTASLEDSVAVSYKTKHTITIQHSKCAPCYLLKEVENIHTSTSKPSHGCSSIHNCYNFAATSMSFSS